MGQMKTIVAAVGLAVAASWGPADALLERSPADNNAEARKPADLMIPYGDHKHQYVDIRLPDTEVYGPGPYPTILVIHGGCWLRPYASAKNIGALADSLRDEGYVTVNMEYRTLDEAGGGWPGTFDDISTVADRLRDWAKEHPIDLSRVAAIGHSAGGHLALWTLARQSLGPWSPLYHETPLPLRGAIALGGPGDLLAAREAWTKGCGIDTVTAILQGPEMRDFNAGSASPAERLPFPGKQVLITGSLDRIVPTEVGDAYVARAAEKDVAVTHITLDGIGHHDYLSKSTAASWDAITTALRDIFAD